jgi:hypothetical protein
MPPGLVLQPVRAYGDRYCRCRRRGELRELIVGGSGSRGAAIEPDVRPGGAGRCGSMRDLRRAGHLWLAIHHLAATGCRGGFWWPDLAAAWQAVAAGQAVKLAGRGDHRSGIVRSGWLTHALEQSVAQELSFWRGVQREPSLLLSASGSIRLATGLGTQGI